MIYWSKKESKDKESIQLGTTPDPEHQWETRAKRSALSHQVSTSHQQTDEYESITKQDRNNINDPHKKHRLGTVSKNI